MQSYSWLQNKNYKIVNCPFEEVESKQKSCTTIDVEMDINRAKVHFKYTRCQALLYTNDSNSSFESRNVPYLQPIQQFHPTVRSLYLS